MIQTLTKHHEPVDLELGDLEVEPEDEWRQGGVLGLLYQRGEPLLEVIQVHGAHGGGG